VGLVRPSIQYVKTTDGARIAYSVAGDGPPLIRATLPGITHVERDWTMYRDVLPKLAGQFTVVWYDSRGTGLSDRSNLDFSMSAMQRDLEAVVQASGFERFALIGWTQYAPIALVYAAQNPQRVTHLVIADGTASPAKVNEGSDQRAASAVMNIDWDLYVDMVAKLMVGPSQPEYAQAWAEHYKASVTPEALQAMGSAVESLDWEVDPDMLARIEAPTLVIFNRGVRFVDLSHSQDIAAAIRGSRLTIIDDPVYSTVPGLVADFVLPTSARPVSSTDASSLRTVLFTDVVGHSEMMSRLGDERGRAILREHESITREVLKANGGTEVKTMGDGFMASFGSVTKAVECAIALQRAFAEREGEPLAVRVGLNAGEPIEEDGDLFGATVILASRIAAKAGAGEILVSDTVRGLCSGKGFLFADRGEFVAKGFEEPVRVYEVSWR
jgi:class 3 adenylate cyclase